MADTNKVREAVRFVVGQMLGRNVEDSEPLISSGLIDSLSILKLIGNLEVQIHSHLPTERLQPDDFENIDIIVETVERVAEPR